MSGPTIIEKLQFIEILNINWETKETTGNNVPYHTNRSHATKLLLWETSFRLYKRAKSLQGIGIRSKRFSFVKSIINWNI